MILKYLTSPWLVISTLFATCTTYPRKVAKDWESQYFEPTSNFPSTFEGTNVTRKLSNLQHYLAARRLEKSDGYKKNVSEERFDRNSISCGDGLCSCSAQTATCNGTKRSIEYIPKLPTNISQLYLFRCEIPHWGHETFENVSHIRTLSLEQVKVYSCQIDTFHGLRSLTRFEYSFERITEVILQKCLRSITSRNFQYLKLLYVHFNTKLSGHFLSVLNDSKLSNIHMQHTYIGVYNHTDYSNLKDLKNLTFIACWIKETKLGYLPKLTYLDFTANALVDFPKFCPRQRPWFPKLSELRISSNFIRYFSPDSLSCMKYLRELHMSENPFLRIEHNTFFHNINLEKIVVNRIAPTGMHKKLVVRPYAFHSASLKRLYFTGIDRPNFQLILDSKAFKYCPKIEILIISDHDFSVISDNYFTEMFGGLTNLKKLSLTNTRLSFLPSVISTQMPYLEVLYLDRNEIFGWSFDYFEHLYSLKILNLSSNSIATINQTSFTIKTLRGLKRLDISHNPYSCSCVNLLWFRTLLRSKFIVGKLDNFPEHYRCRSPSKWEDVMITETPISNINCLLDSHVSLLITIICLVAFCLMSLASLVYRYRWHIRYRLYMIRYYYTRYQRLVKDDSEYEYDVYVSCCEDDLGFVMSVLMPYLEKTMSLRVFLPSRDGLGQTNVGCATRNIDVSKRVIICVSNAYSLNSYCEIETELVCDRVTYERCDLMVVILLEEVKISRMTKSLHKVLNVDDYIKWDNTEEGNTMFWRKLERVLSKQTGIRPR